MLEHYFKYPGVLRRLRRGGLGNDLDRIAAYLFDNSYQQASAKVYLSRSGRFSDFVLGSDPGRQISQSVIDSFVAEHTTKASRVGARTAVALTRRIVPERFERRPEVHDPHALLLGSYSDYLREVRGLEAKTREGQLLAARRMLGWWDGGMVGWWDGGMVGSSSRR
jgi:integrase/recombinase XerD